MTMWCMRRITSCGVFVFVLAALLCSPAAAQMQQGSAIRGCSNWSWWEPTYKPDASSCYTYCSQNGANACEWFKNGDCYVEFGTGCYVEGGYGGWWAAVVSGGNTDPPQAAGTIIGAMYHNWYTPDRWTGRGPYMPVLGQYDSADRAVINQHIAWAKRAGINTMVIDAWITDGDQGWMDRNTPNILDGFDANGISYFFIADGWFSFPGTDPGNLSANAVASRVNAYFRKYFDRPGYLKVNNKPALFFWASDDTPCEFWRRVRAGIEGTIGPIYMTGFTNSATDNKCFDRLMYYNPFNNADGSYQAQISAQERMWNQVFKPSGTPWAPTATPGYNDVHLGRGNPPVPLNADYFRQSMQTALRAKGSDSDRWMFVCSFNEWYEASVIEPNTSFADPEIFLKVMRQELEAAGWLEGTSPTPTPTPTPTPANGNILESGQMLLVNESLTSTDGRFTLVYQADGNLVLYQGMSSALWSSKTSGKSVGQVSMQGDGNLVIYDAAQQPVWFSSTAGNPGASLRVQDDGNAVIYTPELAAVWSTDTAGH